MRDPQKIIAVTLAIILHVLVMASFVFAFDWARRDVEPLPLAVTATLVSADEPVRPPVVEQEPEPEPESEPEPVPEPEEPEPDPAAEARAKAEEQARLEELRRDQQRQEEARLQRIEDEKRKAEEEARRKAAEEEAQRKQEAELERQREQAERRRKEEEEQQRQENERLRREEEERQLQEQVEAEDRRLSARNSEDMAAYEFAIQQERAARLDQTCQCAARSELRDQREAESERRRPVRHGRELQRRCHRRAIHRSGGAQGLAFAAASQSAAV